MKKPFFTSLTATLFVAGVALSGLAQAQGKIYRCGNEYTNTVPPGQKGCKPLEGGNVTIVPRAKTPEAVRVASSGRVDGEQQRQRDAGARQILEGELRKAEARQAELLREFNNGEPDKMGPEFRNHQKYLDRVADIKASIERNESDIAGLRRELGRLDGAAATESK